MIYTGSCSWTEKSLIRSGEFYPNGIKSAGDRLRYYADHFSTVEVDSSYYAIPDRGNAALWAIRTPDDFIFHVKAFGALTGHGIDPKTLPKDIASLLPASERDKRHVYKHELNARGGESSPKSLLQRFLITIALKRKGYYLNSPTLRYVRRVLSRRRSFACPI